MPRLVNASTIWTAVSPPGTSLSIARSLFLAKHAARALRRRRTAAGASSSRARLPRREPRSRHRASADARGTERRFPSTAHAAPSFDRVKTTESPSVTRTTERAHVRTAEAQPPRAALRISASRDGLRSVSTLVDRWMIQFPTRYRHDIRVNGIRQRYPPRKSQLFNCDSVQVVRSGLDSRSAPQSASVGADEARSREPLSSVKRGFAIAVVAATVLAIAARSAHSTPASAELENSVFTSKPIACASSCRAAGARPISRAIPACCSG